MAKRRRRRKKEIREDQLVTVALKMSTFVQERFTQVISGVVVLIAAIAIVLFTAHARRNSAENALGEFAIAMNQYYTGQTDQAGTTFANIADQYAGQRVGQKSLYYLGQTRFSQMRFEEGIEAYDRYLSKVKPDADFYLAALIAKAYCQEGLGQFDAAAATLEKALAAMDASDGRFDDVRFDAATFHQSAGNDDAALELFRQISEESIGPLRARAVAWVAILE